MPLLILPPAPSPGCETMPMTGRPYAAGSGGAAHSRAPAFPLGSRMTPADDGARRAGRRRRMSRRGERDESIGKTTGARGRPVTDGGG